MKNLLLPLIVLCFSCRNTPQTQELPIVDIESVIDKKDFSLKMSEYLETITYLPLETNEDWLIDKFPRFTFTDKEIVVTSVENCFIFDRETGKFLKKIGVKGKGPGEYHSTKGFVNPEKRAIYLSATGGGLLEYKFDGSFVKTIEVPEVNSGFEAPSFPSTFTWLDNNIVAYFSNIVGLEKKRLMILDEDENILKKYPNHHYYSEKKDVLSFTNAQFYHFKNNLFFKEQEIDTVYKVSEKNLTPSIRLYLGKYERPYDSKWDSFKVNEKYRQLYAYISTILETESFLFFKFYFQEEHYQGVFNKKSKQVNIAEEINGIINNVDGFVPFSPVALSQDGYLIDFIESYQLVEWFAQNPDKAAKLPLHLQKFKNIKDTDNPVLMIAKPKK